jgi:hypothetical protein
MPTQIVFKGKTYASADEMPPDVRQAFDQVMKVLADENQNGTPDILEGGLLKGMGKLLADEDHNGVPDAFENAQIGNITHTATFVVNGQTYDKLENLPPEARQKYEAAMVKLDANRNGAQDWLEALATRDQMASNSAQSPNIPISTPVPEPTIIETESSDGRLALAGCMIVVLLIAVAGMVYLLWLR